MGFKWIFGKKKKTSKVATSDSLATLRETEYILLKKQELLEQKIEVQLKIARENATKNKHSALRALKTKKMLEVEIKRVDGTLSTIQAQITSLEDVGMNAEIFKTLGAASKSMKNANNNMNVDQVHELMEEINEQHELSAEIATAISNPYGRNAIDDDELMAELEQIEQENLDDQLLKVGPKEKIKDDLNLETLPSVPTNEFSRMKFNSEEELSKLAAWATS